jgi:hypothetical protein
VFWVLTARPGQQSSEASILTGEKELPDSLPDILFWMRELEQENTTVTDMQVRDFSSLLAAVLTHHLLYRVAVIITPEKYALKPTYDHPTAAVEQESNLRKILSFYVQNKILKIEPMAVAKKMVKRERSAVVKVVAELMGYARGFRKSVVNVRLEPGLPPVSFAKFAEARNEENKPTSSSASFPNTNNNLSTTMANNNSFAGPVPPRPPSIPNKGAKECIEVTWMRQLGFGGDLSLNNGYAGDYVGLCCAGWPPS